MITSVFAENNLKNSCYNQTTYMLQTTDICYKRHNMLQTTPKLVTKLQVRPTTFERANKAVIVVNKLPAVRVRLN